MIAAIFSTHNTQEITQRDLFIHIKLTSLIATYCIKNCEPVHDMMVNLRPLCPGACAGYANVYFKEWDASGTKQGKWPFKMTCLRNFRSWAASAYPEGTLYVLCIEGVPRRNRCRRWQFSQYSLQYSIRYFPKLNSDVNSNHLFVFFWWNLMKCSIPEKVGTTFRIFAFNDLCSFIYYLCQGHYALVVLACLQDVC